MTIFEYAIYRCGANLMTVAERVQAEALAKKADAGDRMALLSFRELAMDVIADAKNREFPESPFLGRSAKKPHFAYLKG